MRVNEKPRISVNKLGEYIYASPARKRKILLDAKFPPNFITTRYSPVQNATIKYFASSEKDIEVFDKVKEILSKKPFSNEHQKETIKSCIEALNKLTNCVSTKLVPYNDYSAIKGYKDCKAISVNDVLISLRPEILLLSTDNKQPIGAIKLAISKNHFLSIQEGQCIAGLIKSYLEKELSVTCNYKECIVLDVFSGRVIYAPVKNEWTISKVENACIDIKNIWPILEKKAA